MPCVSAMRYQSRDRMRMAVSSALDRVISGKRPSNSWHFDGAERGAWRGMSIA